MNSASVSKPGARTGGQLVIDQLIIQQVDRIACVPGESYLAVLDALHDAGGIDVLVCRHESGAAIMAEAYGKLTGRPGICFVTRGPGATNASAGVHIAAQDSTPMVLFVGQVARGMMGREAFQEVDYQAMFGTVAKAVVEIDSAARIPELLAKAFRLALQGRPGPVVVSLPEDVLTETAEVNDAPLIEPADLWPSPSAMETAQSVLKNAARPLIIAGGSAWTPEASADLVRLSEHLQIPVATSFRRAYLFPGDHPNYAGDVGLGPNPKLVARIKNADVVLLLGGRMSETPSGAYTLLHVPDPQQTLIHVHPGMEELGRVYQPALAVNANPGAFLVEALKFDPIQQDKRADAVKSAREDFDAWTQEPAELPGKFQFGEVMTWLRQRMPADAILCNGAGNYTVWLHRFYRYRTFHSELAPTSGSMGYGVPAAVMAKRQHPDRMVVAFAGDGCFLMTGQEFATAVQYGIALIIVVIDNAMYGTIRMHQERHYPGRVSATALKNPDFAAYARAFGGHGERVERTEDFEAAFERCVASGQPSIIHCLIDPEALTPDRSLSAIRAAATKV